MLNLKSILSQLQRDRTRAQNEVSRLDEALASIGSLLGRRTAGPRDGAGGGRRRMSAAGRRRIAAAQRARWAKVKQGKPSNAATRPTNRVRKISQAARNKMAAAQRARWAKVRQQQKSRKKSAEPKAQPENK